MKRKIMSGPIIKGFNRWRHNNYVEYYQKNGNKSAAIIKVDKGYSVYGTNNTKRLAKIQKTKAAAIKVLKKYTNKISKKR